jgi:hypothetical protein
MKKKLTNFQSSLSKSELEASDIARHAHYPEILFLHAIVQRGTFWYTAFTQVDGGWSTPTKLGVDQLDAERIAEGVLRRCYRRVERLCVLVLQRNALSRL